MNRCSIGRLKYLLGSAAVYSFYLLPVWMGLVAMCAGCQGKPRLEAQRNENPAMLTQQMPGQEPPQAKIPVLKVVPVKDLFHYLDEVVRQNDSSSQYRLSENLLLRANPWILDTLIQTDYYLQMALGNFVYDQRQQTILTPGDTLIIPGPKTAATLLEKMANTWLDINIPAFELYIKEGDSVLYTVPVRVGKNQKKHLEMAGHMVDLRTRTGTGTIIRVNRFPVFYDPVTGKQFKFTKRDDHKTTWMPQIPWLEPSINGQRYGQMIHPTTNPRTLRKAASNGCIGVGEADAWRLYVFAPLGTKVVIRYQLQTISPSGDSIQYPDIYRLKKRQKEPGEVSIAGFLPGKTAGICQCDTLY